MVAIIAVLGISVLNILLAEVISVIVGLISL
jgi:hypothetical protein